MAKDSAVREVAPTGKLYIDTAAEIRASLLKAFLKPGTVLFRWDSVEDVELPALQLVYAARKEAARTGREFHFTGIVMDRVASRLVSAGFVPSPPLSGEELEANLSEF